MNMISQLKNSLLLFFIILSVNASLAQGKPEDVNIHFLKNKIEIGKNQTFFNVLIIENVSNTDLECNLRIDVPKDWNLIGSAFEKIYLPANQSQSIPIRVAVAKNSQGGIGYSVTASLLSLDGYLLKTESSFFSFPVKNNLSVTSNNTVLFFSHQTFESPFFVKLNNKGNVKERVNIKLTPEKYLFLGNKLNSESIYQNFFINSEKDTILNFTARLNTRSDFERQMYYKVDIETATLDSLYTRSIWFKYINWQFINTLQESEYPLIVELSAQNLFNDADVNYRFSVYGNVLLKNKKNIFYRIENYNQTSDKKNLWLNSKWHVGYKDTKTTFVVGDYVGNFEQNMYGRGYYLSHTINKSILKSAITHKLTENQINYAISYMQNFNRNATFETGIAYSDNKTYAITDKVIFVRPAFSINNNARIDASFGFNQNTNPYTNKLNGFGYRLNYSSNLPKFRIDFTNEFGSPHYVGYNKGKFNLKINTQYNFENPKNRLLTYATSYILKPPYLQDGTYYTNRYTNSEQITSIFQHQLNNILQLNLGAIYTLNSSNNIGGISPTDVFGTQVAKLEAGVRVSEPNTYNSLYFAARFGYADVYKYASSLNGIIFNNLEDNKNYSLAELRFSLRQKNFGLFIIYINGPTELTQQFSYFYNNYFSKSFSIMPYYENYLYKKILKVSIRASYLKDLTANNSRSNINTYLQWNAPKNWSIELINAISIQQRIASGNSSFYISNYFEVNIKKLFGIRQPRIKYYNLNTLFFKDYNGDGKKTDNEPGFDNVHAALNRNNSEADLQNPNYDNQFIATELLSNQDGRIYYENMPEGEYLIDYKLLNQVNEDFYNEEKKHVFDLQKDTTILIPFKEKNKIFGKVVLNRAKYSKEQYSLANIRVTVTGNNETFTTLTNETGYFEITIPVTETYNVEINNIFEENFTLRQKSYNVRFNGYKQFEVTFEFDEKKPLIVFKDDELLEKDENDVTIDTTILIQQTNLRGEVLCSKTLDPLFATISVKNQKGEVISEMMASVKTGKYSTTFFTGKGYNLTVSFAGYWSHYEQLNINQITTFDYITRNLTLDPIVKGERIKTNNLFFESEKIALSETAKAELDILVNKLRLNLDVKFEIHGYVSNSEAQKADALKLSESRALAVMDYLAKSGISKNRMSPIGLGNSKASASESAQDRRVELIVTEFNTDIRNH